MMIALVFLCAFAGIGNAERNDDYLRHGGGRTLRAEDEVSSTRSNVEKYMSSAVTAAAATTRQSTASAVVDLPCVSLPSFTLIVGPLISLSSNTGSLLSIENNVAIRMNTLSGLQYAIEYYLNNTFTNNTDLQYWDEFEYAKIDSLDYIQNVAAPASNNDAASGEYIAIEATGIQIYFNPPPNSSSLFTLPTTQEGVTTVTSAITTEDKLANTIRTLSNPTHGGGIAAQLYMCQTVSIIEVVLPTTTTTTGTANGNGVACVEVVAVNDDEITSGATTAAAADEIPTVVPVTTTTTTTSTSLSSDTNPNFVTDAGSGGTNPNFVNAGGDGSNSDEESSSTNPNSSSSSSSSGTNPNNSVTSGTTTTTSTGTTKTPTIISTISMSPSTTIPSTYSTIPTYPPTMYVSALVSSNDGTTTIDNNNNGGDTTTTAIINNNGDGSTATITNGEETGDGNNTTTDNGNGATTTTTTTDNGDGTLITDNGDGTTTTTDNGDGTSTTTTTTNDVQQQSSGQGFDSGGHDVIPTYSPPNDAAAVDLSNNIALKETENGGMNKSMVMKGAIGGVLMGIVILGMIAIALFVRGKKRHRTKEMVDNGGGNDDGIKIVPMSTLLDSDLENGDEEETDHGINFHSDMVNVVNDTTAADDAYYNLCCAPRDAMQTPPPLTVDKEEDRAFDRLMTNALKACNPTTTKDSSKAPQLNCATIAAATAAAGAAAIGMAAGWTTSRALAEETDDDNSAEVVDDDSTSKALPLRLRCHDSLHKMCPLNFDQICQKDPYGNIHKEDDDDATTSAKNLVFDDIDKAYDLARNASIEREGLATNKEEGVDGGGDDGSIEELIRQAERRATTNGSDTASVDTKEIVSLVQAQLSQFNMKTPPRDTRSASPSSIRDSAPHDIVNNIKTAVAMKESSVTIPPNKKPYLERPPSTSSTVPSTAGHEVRNIWFTSKEPEEEKYGIIDTINTAAKGNRSPEHLRNKSLPNVVTPTQSILRNTARYNASPVNVSREDPPPSGSCFTSSSDEITHSKSAGRVMCDDNDSSLMGGSSLYDETVVHQLYDECESPSPSTVPSSDFGVLEERGRKARQKSDTLKTKLESILGRAARSMSPGMVRSGREL